MVIYRLPHSSDSQIISTQKIRLKHVKKECQIIIADSISTKNDIIEILEIDAKKISVIYPGVNESFKEIDDKSKELILKKYNLKTPFILAVGKNDPRKNLGRVIKAFKKLTIPANLVIVGSDGWGEDLIREDKVTILKNIEAIDLPAIYGTASMLVYPSLYEGFGLPVIEAQKCGCPVITSQSGSLKEVVGDSALFVDPFSVNDISAKILKLFNDQILRKKLISSGIVNAERFSWEKAATNIIRIYESL